MYKILNIKILTFVYSNILDTIINVWLIYNYIANCNTNKVKLFTVTYTESPQSLYTPLNDQISITYEIDNPWQSAE